MQKVPVPEYTEEEIRFAEKIAENAGLGEKAPEELFSGLEPLESEPVPLAIGTDVSDVSHTVPAVMLSAACMCKGTPLHHWAATADSPGRDGHRAEGNALCRGMHVQRGISSCEGTGTDRESVAGDVTSLEADRFIGQTRIPGQWTDLCGTASPGCRNPGYPPCCRSGFPPSSGPFRRARF